MGHELGHLVRQNRMGPGLAGLPIDDPASESGADALAAGAMGGPAGAVRAFTPAPAAASPMEGGRLWNRIKQDAHRWFGGKIGSWWRRRSNKEAARANVEAEADANFKFYADPWKKEFESDYKGMQGMSRAMADRAREAGRQPDFWHDGVNPLQDHAEMYPEFMFPRKLYDRLANIPGDKLNYMELALLRSAAGNPASLASYIKNKPLTGPTAPMPRCT